MNIEYIIVATLGNNRIIIDRDFDQTHALELWLRYKAGYGYNWIITLEQV